MPTGWTFGGDKSRVRVDESYAHQGKNALLLSPGPVPTPPVMLTFTTPPEGQKITLSMWVLTDGTAKELHVLSGTFKGPDGKDVLMRLYAPPDRPWWTRVEQTFEYPAGSTKFWFGGVLPDVGNIWIDDVSLKTEDGVELIENGGFEK
jgi:hypothetical protein